MRLIEFHLWLQLGVVSVTACDPNCSGWPRNLFCPWRGSRHRLARAVRATLIVMGVAPPPSEALLFGEAANHLPEESRHSLLFLATGSRTRPGGAAELHRSSRQAGLIRYA